jgi:ribosomal protein S21
MPTIVRKKPGQSDDKLIADFRKKVLSDEVLLELKKREHYYKPSQIRQARTKAKKSGRRSIL